MLLVPWDQGLLVTRKNRYIEVSTPTRCVTWHKSFSRGEYECPGAGSRSTAPRATARTRILWRPHRDIQDRSKSRTRRWWGLKSSLAKLGPERTNTGEGV